MVQTLLDPSLPPLRDIKYFTSLRAEISCPIFFERKPNY
jgi:hypothetical protein